MHFLVVLAITITSAAISQAAVYPFLPFTWWGRAPDKDIPASVAIQQVGGSYVYSTAEGKAYQALAPPVAAVHVQALPPVSVRYLPSGQAVFVPTGYAPAPVPSTSGTNGENSESDIVVNSSPDAVGVSFVEENVTEQEPPREPAPVTEQQEDNVAAESS